jgi:hypothetical protein
MLILSHTVTRPFSLCNQEESAMPVYMVERDLPGITTEQLGAAQKAAIEKGKEFTANGKNVRYIRSVFVPGESKCMCLFEASSPELVKEVANPRSGWRHKAMGESSNPWARVPRNQS